jgi:hypothetical protein
MAAMTIAAMNVWGAAIVAGMDAPPVLEAPEHDLDLVAGLVEGSVVGDRLDSVRLGRDTGRNAAGDERRAQPVGVIALVADKSPGVRQTVEDQCGTLVIACLAFRQGQDERPTLVIANRVQLGIQAALRAPDTSGEEPLFEQARRRAVRLQVGRVDHCRLRRTRRFGQRREDAVERAHAAPADEPVVQRLVRTVGRRRVAPTQSALQHEDDAAHHASVIDARHPMRQREIRRDQAHLRLRKPKQTTHDGTSKRCNGMKPHIPEQVPRAHRSLVAALSTLSAQNGIDRKGQT